MSRTQLIKIGLRDGSYLTAVKDYNYFERGIIIENMEKAQDNDIVIFSNDAGADVLIPKKNILFIQIIPIITEGKEKEGDKDGQGQS